MEKTQDLRIIKTETSLINAMLKLMRQKKFDEITVNELCDVALIRRATFYKHYQDKYDFFAHGIRYIFSTFDYTKVNTKPYDDPLKNYLESVGLILDFLSSNKSLIESVMKSNMFPLLMTISTEQITKGISDQVYKSIEAGLLTNVEPQVAVSVMTGAFLSILQLWIEKGDTISREEMLRNVDCLLRRFFV